jgi:hypothetical protein
MELSIVLSPPGMSGDVPKFSRNQFVFLRIKPGTDAVSPQVVESALKIMVF